MIKRFFLSVILYLLMVSFSFAGSILNSPMFQAFDDNGDPLTGGLLYSYISGTTTAKALYTDKACATPDTNPVVLDSRGEAEIYGTVGGYKLVLKTAADVTIWTIDDLDLASYNEAYLYFVDASQSDQGAATAGGNLTVKDFVDSIGSTKKATIVLVHTGSSNTTAYTFQTSETITSNINVCIQNGALITDDSNNANLTINGKIKALDNQKIFDWVNGSGSITYNYPVHAAWTGSIGDGSTDDTDAIDLADSINSVVFTSKTYGIKDCELTNPPIIEGGAKFQVLSGVSSYGLKLSWDAQDDTAQMVGNVEGGIFVNVEGRSETFTGLLIDTRRAVFPSINIIGDESGTVTGVELASDGDYPITFNEFGIVRSREVSIGLLMNGGDADVDRVWYNTFNTTILNLCDSGLKYSTETGTNGVRHNRWYNLVLDNNNKNIHMVSTNAADLLPREEIYHNLVFDDDVGGGGKDNIWFYLDTCNPNRCWMRLPGDDEIDGYSTVSPYEKRIQTVNSASSGGLRQKSATFRNGTPKFGNINLQNNLDERGISLANNYNNTSAIQRGLFHIEPLDLSDTDVYKWTVSSSGTNEYYCDLIGGGDPSLSRPNYIAVSGDLFTPGVVGSLAVDEFVYGDNDSLGYSTVYIRLTSGADPDTLGASGGNDAIIYDIDFTDTPSHGVFFDIASAKPQTVDQVKVGSLSGSQIRVIPASNNVYQKVPNSEPADGTFANSELSIWLDESGNNLTFKVKYSGGTVRSGTVALTP